MLERSVYSMKISWTVCTVSLIPGQKSTISTSQSRLWCPTGIGTGWRGPQKCIAYTEDLAQLIDEHCRKHHMYADDTQMIEQTTIPGIPGTLMKLQSCIKATQEWCKSRLLQLNPAKTELIWFGSKANLKKVADLDLNLYYFFHLFKIEIENTEYVLKMLIWKGTTGT